MTAVKLLMSIPFCKQDVVYKQLKYKGSDFK